MKAIRQKRLITVFAILIFSGSGSFLIFKALDSNLDFFFTPSELIEQTIPDNNRIKIGEMVLEGSIIKDKTNITFQITDYKHSVTVNFDGVVPDLFKEGSGVVALGYLDNGTVFAEQILAKHDENYMPPGMDMEK